MTKETYIKITKPFRENPKMAKVLHIINKGITYSVPIVYFGLLIWYLVQKDLKLTEAIIVPLDSFIILSVVRFLINKPRPYEKFEMPPIIQKDTKGKSFPSRHVFCAFMIAMTFLLWSPAPWIGIVLLIMGCLLAVIRVLSGVHYISDVIVGALCGIAAGLIGFIFVPYGIH